MRDKNFSEIPLLTPLVRVCVIVQNHDERFQLGKTIELP